MRINASLFLCLMLATGARADLITEDVTAPYSAVPGGPTVEIDVPGFDPALGTLDRVLFGYTADRIDIEATVTNTSDRAATFLQSYRFAWTHLGASLFTFADTTITARLGPVPAGATATVSGGAIGPQVPAPGQPDAGPIPPGSWVTSDLTPINLRIVPVPALSGGPGTIDVTSAAPTAGELIVRYVYTPAAVPTPEPPTLVTALVGLVGAGGWWLIRRAA